jgi:hypothetical protein
MADKMARMYRGSRDTQGRPFDALDACLGQAAFHFSPQHSLAALREIFVRVYSCPFVVRFSAAIPVSALRSWREIIKSVCGTA